MKAHLVTIVFKDGSKEGVLFTDNRDAKYALSGELTRSAFSSLADEFRELYGDSGLLMEMQEIEV